MSAEITGTSGVKVQSGFSRDGPPKGKFDCKYLTNKKTESPTKQLPADSKNKSVFKPVKSDENAKTTAFSSKITAKTATTSVKRERKIYSLPGKDMIIL
ncbi:hypothetical protein Nepgr_000911 [Nepenthes gracilis]|uniref:Uncharacterized protein n=1 Tax=Nepenthes gracilis TaxID=150966 RepID=A0AAD3RVR8_NEPGR|nr:hypothetical protein Nepgr_000911 [Nepenthes gracilis]